ncbi:MAG: hypothetical protein ACI9CP_000167 [Cryomorphaceae bacterium]|jgi:hypothetical protein
MGGYFCFGILTFLFGKDKPITAIFFANLTLFYSSSSESATSAVHGFRRRVESALWLSFLKSRYVSQLPLSEDLTQYEWIKSNLRKQVLKFGKGAQVI